MEKLEKHIRKTLEKREIKPSQNAWERIAVKVEQKKKRNPLFPLGIAASIIIMVLLGIQFIFTNDDKMIQPTIEDNSNIIVAIEKTSEEIETIEIESNGIDQEIEEEFFQTPESVVPTQGTIVANEEISEAEENLEINKEEFVSINKIEVSEEAIAFSAQAVLSEVLAMEKDTVQITDAEIDSLLFIAQKQLLANRMNPMNEDGRVDAMALLNEVEIELFESERNQLFDRLKESFFKLRTAVADRNK